MHVILLLEFIAEFTNSSIKFLGVLFPIELLSDFAIVIIVVMPAAYVYSVKPTYEVPVLGVGNWFPATVVETKMVTNTEV